MSPALTEWLAGGSIGLLVGILVGMSASPVVGTVVGAVTAILAAFLGLSGPATDADASKRHLLRTSSSPHRIIAFGLLAVAGLFLGLWMRTHNALSPSRATDVQSWIDAVFPPQEARGLRVYAELGLAPEGLKPAESSAKSTTNSVLYGSGRDACRNLEPRRFISAEETLKAWDLEEGMWTALASLIRKLDAKDPSNLLTTTWTKVCG